MKETLRKREKTGNEGNLVGYSDQVPAIYSENTSRSWHDQLVDDMINSLVIGQTHWFFFFFFFKQGLTTE